ncbi:MULTISPECIES: hypothetical protein [Pseudomonadota]|uniref:single-stranded DNA-binding protein n=1 Tax=Pseudomonadota TaxID=1224 RepID=UPI001F113E70|nr:hypothetical protein [Comamonas sp. A23]
MIAKHVPMRSIKKSDFAELVFVQGKIRNTKYEKDGQTVYGTDFIADKVDYLDTKAPGGSNQE